MKRKTGGLLLALFMSVCGLVVAQSAHAAQKEDLVFVNFRDIRDLNPHLYAGEMYAQGIIFDRLINYAADGYEPALAESWEIGDGGKTYTFKLREGVKFHDGENCDAEAVKANFLAVLDNATRHVSFDCVKYIEALETPDSRTFRVKMSIPYPWFLFEIAGTRPFAMVSPKTMKDGKTKDGISAYIGTEPYKLTDFVRDEYAVFEANENYWGPSPAIEKITVKVIPDNQTRLLALEKGEIDIIYGKNMIDAEAINKYKDSNKFTVALSEPTSTRNILMNATNGVLKDVRIRKALQHATDQDTISKGIFYGVEPPAYTLYSPTIKYCNVGLKPYEYDMEKAAALLDEAGWKVNGKTREKDGEQLAFTLLYNADSVTERTIAEYLQYEYSKLGITMNIKGEEEQSYRDNMKMGHFDIVFNMPWGTPSDPQTSLGATRLRVYGDYEAQLGLPDKKEIDDMITRALLTTDVTERGELFKSVLTRLHDHALYLPLTFECNKALFRSDLKNVTFYYTQYEIPFPKMTF